MQVNLHTDVKRASKSLLKYQRSQLPAATSRALNKTLRGTVTDTKRLTAKRINLTQAQIGKEIRTKFASKKTGTSHKATMIVKGGFKRNLASFKGLRKTKKGLSGKIWKANTKYPGAFVWERTISSGDTAKTAFHRVKGADKAAPSKGAYANRRIKRGTRKGEKIKRQPIKPIYGDSVVNIFTREGRQPSVQRVLRRTIPKRFAKAMAHELRRIKR